MSNYPICVLCDSKVSEVCNRWYPEKYPPCAKEDVEPLLKELKQLKAEFSKVLSEAKSCCKMGVEWYEIAIDFAGLKRLKKLVS